MPFRNLTLFLALYFAQQGIASEAEILAPPSGSNLTSSDVTFQWSPGPGQYILHIGTEAAGRDLYDSGFLSNDTLSEVVSGLPANQIVHLRFWCEIAPGAGRYRTTQLRYNTDLDQDGVLNDLDQNPTQADPKITQQIGDNQLTILSSGRVANLVSPPLFEQTFEDMTRSEAEDLTGEILTFFKDDFDFIFIASNQTATPENGRYAGIFFNVQNSISGLGTGNFDRSARFGSDGKLQGVMHLSTTRALRRGPSLHELAHNWGNYLDAIPTEVSGHWGFANIGGQLGGWEPNSLESLGGGRYQAANPRTGEIGSWGGNVNGGNGVPYSRFELYTMGLIAADSVGQEIKIANDFAWEDRTNGIFTASSITTRSMSDVISIDGPRLPSVEESQKEFRVLYLILSSAPLTTGEWGESDDAVFQFARPEDDGSSLYNFWEATEGLAQLEMGNLVNSLRSSPLVPPAIQNTIFTSELISIEIATAANRQYSLQHSPDLSPDSWDAGTVTAGTGSLITLSRAIPQDQESGYYRVSSSPAP